VESVLASVREMLLQKCTVVLLLFTHTSMMYTSISIRPFVVIAPPSTDGRSTGSGRARNRISCTAYTVAIYVIDGS
jgi:hypothetical protein